jgi:hypothetical protein
MADDIRAGFDKLAKELRQALIRVGARPINEEPEIIEPYGSLWSRIARNRNRLVIALYYGPYLHEGEHVFWCGYQSSSNQIIKNIVDATRNVLGDPVEYKWNRSQLYFDPEELDRLHQNGGLSYEWGDGWSYFGRYDIARGVSDRSYIEDILNFLNDVRESASSASTEYQALILARKGQGDFRRKLDSLWEGRCAVTGCQIRDVLRASHIKPWKSCTNEERLDPDNGLLLNAMLDALFDKGLISFDEHGKILLSRLVQHDGEALLGVQGDMALQKPLNRKQRHYLAFHQRHVFRGAKERPVSE